MIFLDILLTRFLWSKQASCIIKLSRILINHTTQACTLVLLIGSTLLQLYFCLLIFQTLSASTTFKYRVILEPDSGTQFGHLMKSGTLLQRDGWLSNTALNRDSVWFHVKFHLCRWMLAHVDLRQMLYSSASIRGQKWVQVQQVAPCIIIVRWHLYNHEITYIIKRCHFPSSQYV